MYKKAIVTFLDILGFRQIVESADADAINNILDVIEKAATPDKSERILYEPETIIFSDSIVRVRHVESNENLRYPIGLVFQELLDIVHFQSGLIDHNVLIRGGVTFGDICINENRIYGPAFVRAYDLESQFAKYPRLIVDPNLIKEYKSNSLLKSRDHSYVQDSEHVADLIKQSDDGLWFVDYARAVESELDEPEMYPIFLGRHRQVILEKGSKFKDLDKNSEKIIWLANYHNNLIDEIRDGYFSHYGLTKEEFLITSDELPALQYIS